MTPDKVDSETWDRRLTRMHVGAILRPRVLSGSNLDLIFPGNVCQTAQEYLSDARTLAPDVRGLVLQVLTLPLGLLGFCLTKQLVVLIFHSV
jgi:hypothetical protein